MEYYLKPNEAWKPFSLHGPVRPGPAGKLKWFSHLLPGKVILDVGCGRGEQARVMAEMGAALVVGIDWSPIAVTLSRILCEGLGGTMFRWVDAREYKPPILFQVVTMFDFIEHLTEEDAKAVYQRCAEKWLVPGGWLCVICPPEVPDRFHLYHQTQGTMRRDIEAAGFEIEYLKERVTERGYIYVCRAQLPGRVVAGNRG